ncbi:hypothetical protein [Bdellovibrio bacteriovorus]|uniref:Lipoprotein n=1 Tax=Bdellovibrio bacteriovorus TaxID=959 RepID=A0A1Z3N9U6_BDEBC|nr:hypothetical protein [Bdellovibrio bacteriovorus]ASD64248.1 hypothetical protein B9G79_12055 [Bdellovibrio bacteriovorus]
MIKITRHIMTTKIAITTLLTTACATLETPYSRWDKLTSDPLYQSEKKTFNERLNGKELCPSIGVANFTYETSIVPDKKCIYPDVKIAKVYLESDREWAKSLKVLQVLDNGFIVSSNSPRATTIFIHKTDQEGVVDDTYLANDPNKFPFYEYTGPYSYNSLSGKRTVHSFKKVDRQVFVQAQNGLNSYFYLRDLFGNENLWDWVEAIEKSYKKFGYK